MKRPPALALLSIAFAIAIVLAWMGTTFAQDNSQLTFSVPDARGYAAKFSASKETIEIANSQDACKHRTAAKPMDGDNPDTPYDDCDAAQYTHTPNCPSGITKGPEARIEVPVPTSLDPNATHSGGADPTPLNQTPPQASPVLSNDDATIARLTDLLGIQEAGGLASKRYVDQSGRSYPLAHTESDAFSVNRSVYEERCSPSSGNGAFTGSSSTYTHVYSRSTASPSTVHLAECLGDCRFVSGGGTYSPRGNDSVVSFDSEAREARTISKLTETGGKIVAEQYAIVKGLNFGGGLVTADEIVSYSKVTSDGTKKGLAWTVITYANGTTLCGKPTDLKPGSNPFACAFDNSGGDLQVGMSAPYVKTNASGTSITIVLPGMVVAWNKECSPTDCTQVQPAPSSTKVCLPEGSPQPPPPLPPVPSCPVVRAQTFHFAGVELRSGQGRAAPQTYRYGFDNTGSGYLDTFSVLGTSGYSLPLAAPPRPTAEGPIRTVAIKQYKGTMAPAGSLLGLGALALVLLFLGWIRRFAWGRELFRMQPFRFFFWFYRAFIRT